MDHDGSHPSRCCFLESIVRGRNAKVEKMMGHVHRFSKYIAHTPGFVAGPCGKIQLNPSRFDVKYSERTDTFYA